VAEFYGKHIMDIGSAINHIRSRYNEIKQIELYFFKSHDINIVFEEEAIDYIIERLVVTDAKIKTFYRKLTDDFELGLKLIMEKSGKNRFFISRQALVDPDEFISTLIKRELSHQVESESASHFDTESDKSHDAMKHLAQPDKLQ
jgi:ATP-dependent Clp protease ATP-binding subunit ClpX